MIALGKSYLLSDALFVQDSQIGLVNLIFLMMRIEHLTIISNREFIHRVSDSQIKF